MLISSEQYNVAPSTIAGIKKKGLQIREDYTRHGQGDHVNEKNKEDVLDTMVKAWFDDRRSQNIPVSGPMIQNVARKFNEELMAKGKGKAGFQVNNQFILM